MKLSCHDQSDRVRCIMKTRLDNDIIDFTGACMLYAENDTKLLW